MNLLVIISSLRKNKSNKIVIKIKFIYFLNVEYKK